jgi:hypothetical protein
MRRNVLIAATATALATAVSIPAAGASPGAPAADPASAGDCPFTSSIKLTPGLTMTPKDFTFTQSGTVGPCKGPDGSALSGSLVIVKGTGNGSCPTASVTAPFTVEWDNKKTSSGVVKATTVTAFGQLSGTIDKGLFAGSPFTGVVFINPQGPIQCGTTGITDAVVSGNLAFQ